MIEPTIATAAATAADGGVQPALAHALAEELVGLTSLLADLAYDLAGNPDTLRCHMQSLQDIDRITQTQLAIADVLRSSEPVETCLDAVTLDDLAGRLRRSIAAAGARSSGP